MQEGALDVAGMLREYAIRVAEDRDAARARSRDERRRREARLDDESLAQQLHWQWQHVLDVVEQLGATDPRSVDAPVRDLHEVQALAAELTWRLGRLEAHRRGVPVSSAPAGTLRLVVDRAVAYLRVSTDRQADEGFGLDVQDAAVRRWARLNKVRLAFVVRDEGRSGAADIIDRPGLAEAIGHIRAGRAQALVVPRLDRLARDLVLQEWIRADLIRLGAELRSATPTEDLYLRNDPDDPTGTLVRQILGAVAQYERAMIRLRMDAGKVRKRQAGGYVGGQPPYGFRAIGHDLVPNLDEQRAVQRMRRWRREGKSLRDIANRLNDDGIPARRGRWHPQTVARVLDRASATRKAS